MRYVRLCVVLMLSFVLFPVIANAEESNTCNYTAKSRLNEIAGKITAKYEFKYDNEGNVYFVISVYNITNEVYVSMYDKTSRVGNNVTNIYYKDTNRGTYSFEVRDITSIIEYEFTIRADSYGCAYDVREFVLIKPKKNDLHDLSICQHDETKDYIYCQEWFTENYKITREKMIESINTKILREGDKNTTTTKSMQQIIKEKNEKAKKDYEKIRETLIIVLSIGIVVDSIIIIIMNRRIRRYSI